MGKGRGSSSSSSSSGGKKKHKHKQHHTTTTTYYGGAYGGGYGGYGHGHSQGYGYGQAYGHGYGHAGQYGHGQGHGYGHHQGHGQQNWGNSNDYYNKGPYNSHDQMYNNYYNKPYDPYGAASSSFMQVPPTTTPGYPAPAAYDPYAKQMNTQGATGISIAGQPPGGPSGQNYGATQMGVAPTSAGDHNQHDRNFYQPQMPQQPSQYAEPSMSQLQQQYNQPGYPQQPQQQSPQQPQEQDPRHQQAPPQPTPQQPPPQQPAPQQPPPAPQQQEHVQVPTESGTGRAAEGGASEGGNEGFSKAVVIDNGTYRCKIGFSGEQQPRDVFPALVGRPKHMQVMAGATDSKDVYIAHDAQQKRGMLVLSYPIENGRIVEWDDMQRVCRL